MRSRDLEIDNFRRLITEAQARLKGLGVTTDYNANAQVERANREAAERAKREAAEKAKREEAERLRREAAERAKREAAEKAKREEAERIKKAEQERIKREQEIRNLRNKIAEWQKALDCLLEGKRKYPKSDLTCHGNWTMRSRDTEIANFQKLVKDGQTRLKTLNAAR